MQNQDGERPSRRPAATAFKQQRLKAWQPILTPKTVISTFIVIGISFILIGMGLVAASNSVVEVEKQYGTSETSCPINDWNSTYTGIPNCEVKFDITEKMVAPVYFYYSLKNYYQNHRRYVKSRSDAQLRGDAGLTYSDLESCEPLISLENEQNPGDLFIPCGLIAWSVFNDTFELSADNGSNISWTSKGIAWASDVETKFKNPPADEAGTRLIRNGQPINFTSEEFIVWMRTAGLPHFKKLHRIIDQDLEIGSYTVNISNNYPVSSFGGEKYFVLSTTSFVGGKNPFLGYAYIVVGVISVLLAVGFLIKHKTSPRQLGDSSYLEFN